MFNYLYNPATGLIDVTTPDGSTITLRGATVDTDITIQGDGYISGKLDVNNGLVLNTHSSVPGGNPDTGRVTLWVRDSDGYAIITDENGTDTVLSGGDTGGGSSNLTEPTLDEDGYVPIASGGDLSYIGGNDGDVLTWDSENTTWKAAPAQSTTQASYSGVTSTSGNETIPVVEIVTSEDDTVYSVKTDIMGINTVDGYAAGYEIKGTFKRESGVVTQIGSTLVVMNNEESDWGVEYSVVGSNIQARVTGLAGQTIDWEAFMDVRIAFSSNSDSPPAPVTGGAPVSSSNLIHDLGPDGIPGSSPGDSVTTWTASAGPDVTAVGGTPTRSSINGLPAVTKTNGVYLQGSLTTNNSSDYTLYIVGVWDAQGSSTGLWGLGPSSNDWDFISFSNGLRTIVNTSNDSGQLGTDIVDGTPFILIATYENATSTTSVEMYVDGEAVRSGTLVANFLGATSVQIGARGSAGSQREWSQPIGRVLFYDDLHDTSTKEAQRDALANAWSIAIV